MHTLGYIASIFMGLTLGLMGAGGSILTVPILVYFFAINPILATTYSLFIVGMTALVGGIANLRKREVDLKAGVQFAVPSFIGVVAARNWIVPNLPDPLFAVGTIVVSKAIFIMSAFALLMVLASRAMIRPSPVDVQAKEMTASARLRLIATKGFSVGLVTGFVGAGGGFLIIPALVLLVGLPMKKAVATSMFIIAANSLIGFCSDLRHQPVIDWQLILTVSAIALVGLGMGMPIAGRVSERRLKKAFGFFVLVMGLFVLADHIHRL